MWNRSCCSHQANGKSSPTVAAAYTNGTGGDHDDFHSQLRRWRVSFCEILEDGGSCMKIIEVQHPFNSNAWRFWSSEKDGLLQRFQKGCFQAPGLSLLQLIQLGKWWMIRPNESNSDRSGATQIPCGRPSQTSTWGGLCDFPNRRCRGNWRMRTKSCAKSWATKRWELLRLNGSQQMRFWKSNGNCMVPLTLVWFLSFKCQGFQVF